jgi:hypothetical protein
LLVLPVVSEGVLPIIALTDVSGISIQSNNDMEKINFIATFMMQT